MSNNDLLQTFMQMLAIPAYSKEEAVKADFIENYLRTNGAAVHRSGNNVWTEPKAGSSNAHVLVLNSHIDTVKPNASYTFPAHDVHVKDGKIYGLGTNDAGASLFALMRTFIDLKDDETLNCRLCFLASAEEEISGAGGISSVLDLIDADAFIVGEPTGMKMARAEKGLMVVDVLSKGKAAHAAHDNGSNAIDTAIEDMLFLKGVSLPESEVLGKVKITTTAINAGVAHNMVPDTCRWTLDIRTNECVSHEEIENFLIANLKSEVTIRSKRLRPSFTAEDHFLIQAAAACGVELYASSTLSDQALIPVPSVKIGPGDTLRSHTADEYIETKELLEGIDIYKKLIRSIK